MRLEGLGKLIIFNSLTGFRTRNLSACSSASVTELQRVPALPKWSIIGTANLFV
jgi:hypothetical protein